MTGPKEDEANRICAGGDNKDLPALKMDNTPTALLEYPQDISEISQEAPLVSEIDSNTTLAFRHPDRPSVPSYGEDFYVEMPASPEQTYEEDLMDIEDMGANMYIYNDYKDYSLDLIGENIALNPADQSLIAFINNQLACQDAKAAPIPSTLSATHVFNSSPSIMSKDNSYSPSRCCNDELASSSQRVPSCGSQSVSNSDVACTPTYQTDIIELSQNAIVVVPEAARIPAPVLKNVGRMRTIHYV